MRSRVVFNDYAKLRMVAVIRPGVVLKGVNRAVTDRADRAPGEIAKVDDQVRGYSVTFVVYVLRFIDGGADVDTVGISQGFKFCCEFVPQCFDVVCCDDACGSRPSTFRKMRA